jgi:hypothetical protein
MQSIAWLVSAAEPLKEVTNLAIPGCAYLAKAKPAEDIAE